MARYKCIDDDFSKTFSVWVFVMGYGRLNLGTPEIPWKPKVSGLLKEDALFWAWGQAQMMIDGGRWKISKREPDGAGDGEVTVLEDEHGAKYSIHVANENLGVVVPVSLGDATEPRGTTRKRSAAKAKIPRSRRRP